MMGPVVHSDLWAQSMREFSFHFTVMVGIINLKSSLANRCISVLLQDWGAHKPHEMGTACGTSGNLKRTLEARQYWESEIFWHTAYDPSHTIFPAASPLAGLPKASIYFEATDSWVAALKQASDTPEAETALETDPLAENKLSANTENLCVFDPRPPNSLKVLAKRELVESISTKRKKEPRWSHAIAESWHFALRSLLLSEILITNDTAITGSKSCDRICTTSW